MAARGDQMCIGLIAEADLRLNQYQVVRVTAERRCNVASQNSVMRGMGVLQNTPNSGQNATVAILGETKVVAGAAIANVGIPVAHNASGRVIAATSGLAVIGYNIEAAAADGDVICILLQNGAALGQV